MTETDIFRVATGPHQAFHRSRLAEIVPTPAMVDCLVVDQVPYFDIKVISWDEYWRPHVAALDPLLRQDLEELRKARESHLNSQCPLSAAAPYCHRYFRLLHDTPISGEARRVPPGFLRALLSLETFGIRRYRDSGPRAAGTITARHPVYLLAKLRQPKAYDDPKFLPLVCLPSNTPVLEDSASLFYHYRQFRIDERTNASLLVFPAVPLQARTNSFETIDLLTAVLRSKPDPRSGRRADFIADRAIGPFLPKCRQTSASEESAEISFADLGGGTGVLMSRVCKRLLAKKLFQNPLDSR